jgi:acyl-CoA thioesterase FadM
MARAKIILPDRFIFSIELPLRVSDINYGGHLGNEAVLLLAQEARLQFLKQFNWNEMNVAGFGLIMSDAVVVYKSQAHYGDVVVIDLAVTDLERLTCDFVFRMVNKSTREDIAHVKTGIVFFDYSSNRPVSIPFAFMETIGSMTSPNPGTK